LIFINKALIFLISLILLTTVYSCQDKPETLEEATDGSAAKDAVYEPDYGGTLIQAMSGRPSVLIPMLAGDSASHEVAGLIFNGLVKYDTDLKIIGDLAKSWEISEDGLEIVFHLRKDVRWADGKPFTAEDVLFGYQTIIDEKTPTAYKEDYLQVKTAEVLDPYTFRVTYSKPFAPALSSWGSLVVLPKHLLEGKDITKIPYRRDPVGLGPYILKEWEEGAKLALESNHNYFEGRPYIDRIIYRIIPDPATRFLELKAGGLDYMGLSPLQYTRQTDTKTFRQNFRKYRYPVFSYTYLGFNLQNSWFKNIQVRRAFAHAIDKDEIISAVLFGLGRPATGPYVPNTWPYNKTVKQYEFDPEKARRLLSEAGWQDTNGDGMVERNGMPFEFTILSNIGNDIREKTAVIIQQRLKDIGVKANLKFLEWSTFINEFIDKRRFDAVMLGWSIGLDPDQYDIWHSSKTGEKEFNFVSYSNPEVDNLLEQGRRTFDIEERKKAYFQVQEILAEELPYIFLYVPDALPIIHARVQGIKPSPIGIGYNLPKWFVPKKLQRYSSLEK